MGKTFQQPAVARETIARLFDQRIAAEAATLIKPGMDRERIYVRQTMSRAAGVLVELLGRGGYRIDSIEEEHADSFLLGQLQGRTDLIVRRTKDGMKAIIDLKWSGDKRKIEALRSGTALQLAAYSYFVRTRKCLAEYGLLYFSHRTALFDQPKGLSWLHLHTRTD